MKKYTIEVVIVEGSDEFWDDINKRNVTGCDEVLKMVEEHLTSIGINFEIDGHVFSSSIKVSRFEDV
jgi:hypothetical protein